MQEIERVETIDESGRKRIAVCRKSKSGAVALSTDGDRTLHRRSDGDFEIVPTGERLRPLK